MNVCFTDSTGTISIELCDSELHLSLVITIYVWQGGCVGVQTMIYSFCGEKMMIEKLRFMGMSYC